MTESKKITKKSISYEIKIPQGVDFSLEGNKLTAKGVKGTIVKLLAHPSIKMVKKEDTLVLTSQSTTKKNKRMINSFKAHTQNMIRGVKEGYKYTLKICSGHFPMALKQEGDKVVISNFLGEKIPRVAKILPGIKIVLGKDTITVEGADKEGAGQTAANLETATAIRNRDRRVFQDGIYIIQKPIRVLAQ